MSLKIPPSFWEKFLNEKNNLIGKWTNALSDIFNAEPEYKYCVLAFSSKNEHTCKNGEFTFSATPRCKNSYCTRFKFSYKGNPRSAEMGEMKIYHQRPIAHNKNEKHRRFCNGEDRDNLKDMARGKSGLKCQEEICAAADKAKVENGNLNKIPSLDVIHKAQSEDRRKFYTVEETNVKRIYRLIENYNETWKGEKVQHGFIQEFKLLNFGVQLFTEQQLKVLLDIPPGKVFCHIDATGKLIKKFHQN